MPGPDFAPLLAHRAVRLLAAAAGSTPCHLVGGALRDQALGLSVHDLDAVSAGRGIAIAQDLARALPARLVPLGGKEFAAYRLVASGLTLDLWDREETTLEEDLARRDLTINAIALDLATGAVTDPFGGLEDLERKILRATTPESIAGDPLRVLRLARLLVQLPGFTADGGTVELARASSPDLPEIAAERIRDELARTVGDEKAALGVEMLGRVGVYPGLWIDRLGEVAPIGEVVGQLEVFKSVWVGGEGRAGLPVSASAHFGRWALLFAGLSKLGGAPTEALERFRVRGYLAKSETVAIGRLLALASLPGQPPERRLFLHRLGRELWPVAAAVLAARGTAASEDLEDLANLARTEGDQVFDPPRLVSAEEVQALLGLSPGRDLGRALSTLREAQVRGEVRTRAEAEAFLRGSGLAGSPPG